MILGDWIKNISIDTIPSEQMQMIAEHCGIADAVSLMQHLPGIEIYVPAAGKKRIEQQYIHENYNGTNASTIAVKLGLDREKVKHLAKLELNTQVLSNYYMRLVAERCGEPVAIRLMQNFARYKFYVPRDGFSIVRRKFIEQSFNGSNVSELALTCKVTERHVRKVISDMYNATAQTSLFSV